MLNPGQFRRCVIRPALKRIGLHSLAAEALLLGTALTESGLEELVQRSGGPGLGLFQVEPATHSDIWLNYLVYRPVRAARVASLAAGGMPRERQLIGNLPYATAIARTVYYRRPEPLPAADDLRGQAEFWKAHFNTSAGRGRVEDFVKRAGEYLT